MSFSSATEKCQKETGEFEGQHLAVIDTPGLFDTDKTQEEVIEEVGKCISMSAPGPHVFLVVIQANRFTKEEQKTVKIIQWIFGRRASAYTMVLFTHGDNVKAHGKSIEELVATNEKVSSLISQCGGGYHLFDNESKDLSQVRELLKKINAMIARNGGQYYTNEMFKEVHNYIQAQIITIVRQYPDLDIHQARRMAERDNQFIRSLKKSISTGALVGAACGVSLGPVGVVVGAALGASVGCLISLVRNLRKEESNACVLQ